MELGVPSSSNTAPPSPMPWEEGEGWAGWGGRQKGQGSCLELFGVIEADPDSRHHPCVEECLQDVPGHCVSHQVEVQWVFPLGRIGKQS